MDAEFEQKELKRTRADKRGSKGRKEMLRRVPRLEADGTASLIVHTTRPFNQKSCFSQRALELASADPSFHSAVESAVRLQSEGLKQMSTASRPAGPSAPSGTTQPPSVAATSSEQVQQWSIRAPSAQAAAEDNISRWNAWRLGATARVAELVEFLRSRDVILSSVRTRDSLLDRVSSLLSSEYPEGRLFVEP